MPRERQKPLIVKSPLSKRWYVLTRYREKKGIDAKTGEPNFYVVADVKHDVTDQMEAILKKELQRKRKAGR